jgi:acylphosphatase
MKQAVQLKIKGLVQGVFFRQSTLEKARELDIFGWVRNCEDGSVELEAEGDENLLKVFVQWCHRGPRNAAVKEVELKNVDPKNLNAFEIKR